MSFSLILIHKRDIFTQSVHRKEFVTEMMGCAHVFQGLRGQHARGWFALTSAQATEFVAILKLWLNGKRLATATMSVTGQELAVYTINYGTECK